MKRTVLATAPAAALALLLTQPSHAQAQSAVPGPSNVPTGNEGQSEGHGPGREAQRQAVASPRGGLEEVVVTARRRAERAQTAPVSVSVLSAATLRQKNIQEVQDLNNVVPGFRFGSNGGKSTNDVTLRGLSRIPLGAGVPAVVEYFADVPLPSLGSNIPFFDIANVQVFKGPQGTLFGRNSLGGAVVITPVAPTNKLGGYIDGQVGNLGHFEYNGAVNIPLIPDKVELRIAGQVRKQNGYVKAINSDATFSNINENAYRVELLVRPTDWIQNLTTYDFLVAPENAAGEYLLNYNPGVIPGLSALIDPALKGFTAQQHANSPYGAFTDSAGTGTAFRRLQGVTNDTRLDITDDIEVRNILGYRQAYNQQLINTGAVPDFNIGIPGIGAVPFKLYDAAELDNQEYFTDELQLIGHSWHHRISWIIGGFYNHDDPLGKAGANFNAFAIGPSKGTFTTNLVENHNYAIYGQTGIDLSDWTIRGLTLNLGYRYSWDEVHACGGKAAATSYVDSATCEQEAKLGIPGGAGDIGASGSEPSWTVGLDYKYSDNQFFYVTSRRGYRGVNVNTPLFNSPYTTGGVVVPPYVGGPGCTGPGNVCPDLRPFQKTGPEKLTDVEIGSKTDFTIKGMHGRFDIAAYWSDYKGALQFFNVAQTGIYLSAPDLPNNQSVGINAADETIMGLEAGFILQPIPSLTINLDGAYTNAEVDNVSAPSTTGLSLNKSQITLPSPRFSGAASVNYILPYHPVQGNLIFNADWYQTGKFSGQYGIKLPGYGIGNARLSWNNIGHTGFDISLFVRNILDRAYLVSPTVLLNTFPVNSALYAEPRTYGVEGRFTF